MALIGTLGSGVSALQSFEKGLEVIGDNIANVNTVGFKASQANYADAFSNILQQSSSSGTNGDTAAIGVGTGVRLAGVSADFSQGSLSSTSNGNDLGISGNGFFIVKNPVDGTTYATRAGGFRWDDQGYLVTSNGYRVQGATGSGLGTVGDIKKATPPTGTQLQSVSFDKSGNVIESYSNGTSATTNQVLLQNFSDPGALMRQGNNLYSGLTTANPIGGTAQTVAGNAPGTNGLGNIQAGTLELSNVDLTSQFADLITTQRSFQAGSRLVTVSDTILEDITNLKTR